MNRAQRKRQEKMMATATSSPRGRHLLALLSQGMAHHKAGSFKEAAALYEEALDIDPHHPEALHLSGLLHYRTGQLQRAADLLSEAVQKNSSNALYHFNLGIVLSKLGQIEKAVNVYRNAVRLNPTHVEAHSNLGNALMALGSFDAAVNSFSHAIKLNPGFVDAHNNLGVALKEQGRLVDAIQSYNTALSLNPNHAEASYNKGIAHQELGELDEAVEAFQHAVDMRPDYAKAHHSLGLTYLWQQRLDIAFASLRTAADLHHNHRRPVTLDRVYHSRIKHDAEQIQYLMDHGILTPREAPYLTALNALRERSDHDQAVSKVLLLSDGDRAALAPSFSRLLYHAASPTLPQGALNPNLDVRSIEAQYHAKKPEIISVDHLLCEEALASLRTFCLESTIWKRDYENGYIGAFFGEGFACPLLLQIAEELRVRFPGIFRGHRLKQAWAFKHDSALKGLNIHADAAAVNVNFWITLDLANLDPSSGGLVVWDREAPKEWDFKEYNNQRNKPKILEFLRHNNAQAVTIPYRANRAIIFNSDLFHETDQCRFQDRYECRRINVTLLYGNRNREEN